MFIAVSCLLWVLILAHLEGWAIVLGAILGLYCGLGMEAPLAALFLILIFDRILNDKPASVWVYLMVASPGRYGDRPIAVALPHQDQAQEPNHSRRIAGRRHIALFNWVITGHPYSISALIKSGGAALGPLAIAAENFSSAGNVYRYAVVIVANIALFYFIRENARARKPNDARLWVALVITAEYVFVGAYVFIIDSPLVFRA